MVIELVLNWISQKWIRLGGLAVFANVSINYITFRTMFPYNFYWLYFQMWVVIFFPNQHEKFFQWYTLWKKFILVWKPVQVCKIHKQVPFFGVWDLNPFLTSKILLRKVTCLYVLVHNIYAVYLAVCLAQLWYFVSIPIASNILS